MSNPFDTTTTVPMSIAAQSPAASASVTVKGDKVAIVSETNGMNVNMEMDADSARSMARALIRCANSLEGG